MGRRLAFASFAARRIVSDRSVASYSCPYKWRCPVLTLFSGKSVLVCLSASRGMLGRGRRSFDEYRANTAVQNSHFRSSQPQNTIGV